MSLTTRHEGTGQRDVRSAGTPRRTGDRQPGRRGRRQGPLLRLRGDIPRSLRLGLSVAGVVVLFGGWTAVSATMGDRSFLLPTPTETWDAGVELYRSGVLLSDLTASLQRISIGYGLSVAIGIVVGVTIGSFRSAEAFLEPQVGLLRYIPASALTPLFLLWLGIDETPKIALIVVGTVFFNILMIADVARAVPKELVNAAYTLGAGRLTVLRRVILPHSWPGIIDVARVNLAAGWLMLVVAELLAAQEGLAFRVIRAQRFRQVDTMFALLVVFAVIGLASDLTLRALRKRTAPWSEGSR
ncbi:MAG: ABC transporter permease [Acidimicrobiales bacterium]